MRIRSRRQLIGALLLGCGELDAGGLQDRLIAAGMPGGDPSRGVAALQHYSCASCHRIPGVVGARSLVGPPLAGMAKRTYIAGFLPNTPENMLRWLQNPQDLAPASAMPDLGVSEADARDIAAYLYRLD